MKALPSNNLPISQTLEHSSEIDSLPYIDSDITKKDLRRAKKMIKQFRKQVGDEESFDLKIHEPDTSLIEKLISEKKSEYLGKRNWSEFEKRILKMQENSSE